MTGPQLAEKLATMAGYLQPGSLTEIGQVHRPNGDIEHIYRLSWVLPGDERLHHLTLTEDAAS